MEGNWQAPGPGSEGGSKRWPGLDKQPEQTEGFGKVDGPRLTLGGQATASDLIWEERGSHWGDSWVKEGQPGCRW